MKSLITTLILGMLRDLVRQYLNVNKVDALVDSTLDKLYDLIASLPLIDDYPQVLENVRRVIDELKQNPAIAESLVDMLSGILLMAEATRASGPQPVMSAAPVPGELAAVADPLRELGADCCPCPDDENCPHDDPPC